MKISVLVLVLASCSLYVPSHKPLADDLPDAPSTTVVHDATPSLDDPACESNPTHIGCGDGRHCEVQCSIYGPVGCIYNCHATCMPDDPCASVTTCAPGTQCVDSCLDGCQGMADLCMLACGMPDNSCEYISDEAACSARSDCMPIYRVHGCTCTGPTCDCANPHGDYVRCASTTVPG